MTGKRKPAAETMPELLKFAQDGGIDISKYEADPQLDQISNCLMKKNKYRERVRLFELYGRMSRTNKQKFVRYAEKMGK